MLKLLFSLLTNINHLIKQKTIENREACKLSVEQKNFGKYYLKIRRVRKYILVIIMTGQFTSGNMYCISCYKL